MSVWQHNYYFIDSNKSAFPASNIVILDHFNIFTVQYTFYSYADLQEQVNKSMCL